MAAGVPVVSDPVLPRVPRRRRALPRPIGTTLRVVPFGVVLLLAVIGPMLSPLSATEVTGPNSSAPDAAHLAGTDANGLDVLSRTLTAFSLDVGIALIVTVLATGGGILLGLLSGMYEGRRGILGVLSRLISRLADLVQAIPIMIAGLIIVSFFGRNVSVITLSLATVLLPFALKLMRTEVLRVRSEGFVEAARLSGVAEPVVMFRHVVPNAAGAAVENASAIFGMAIIFSAALGFLGVGIPVPTAEWGSMLAIGAPDAAVGRWWPFLFPAAALALSVWSASLFVGALTDRPRRR